MAHRAITGIALLIVGCNAASPVADGPPIADGSPIADTSGERIYLIRRLWIPRPTGNHSIGFDLDSTSRDACGVLDYRSIYPRDGSDGVDAALNNLYPLAERLAGTAVTTDDALRWAIAEARLLWALGIDGETLTLYVASPAEGNAPPLDPAFRPQARAAYVLRPAGEGVASVQGTSFRARLDAIALPAAQVPWVPVEALGDMELAFDEGLEGLERGVIGASFAIDELVREAERLQLGPVVDTVRSYLSHYADLDPGEDGLCARASLALAFDAVPIVRAEVRP